MPPRPRAREFRGATYGPELLGVVEVDIVLGDLLEDTEVVLGLVEGANRGVSAWATMVSWLLGLRLAIRGTATHTTSIANATEGEPKEEEGFDVWIPVAGSTLTRKEPSGSVNGRNGLGRGVLVKEEEESL